MVIQSPVVSTGRGGLEAEMSAQAQLGRQASVHFAGAQGSIRTSAPRGDCDSLSAATVLLEILAAELCHDLVISRQRLHRCGDDRSWGDGLLS